MTKIPQNKTRDKDDPYEIWVSYDTKWEWHVLKKYQTPEKEANNKYARWFCLVKTPVVPHGELGDTYVKDIRHQAYRCDPCPVCGQPRLFSKPIEVRNALSRIDNRTYICVPCGRKEAEGDIAKEFQTKDNIKKKQPPIQGKGKEPQMSLVNMAIFLASIHEEDCKDLWNNMGGDLREGVDHIINTVGDKIVTDFPSFLYVCSVYDANVACGGCPESNEYRALMMGVTVYLRLRGHKFLKPDKDMFDKMAKVGRELYAKRKGMAPQKFEMLFSNIMKGRKDEKQK